MTDVQTDAVAATGNGAGPATGAATGAAPGTRPGRLTAQRLPFVAPTPLMPAEMYAAVERGSVERSRAELICQPRSSVTTNTYFGRFPASHWQRWTSATETELSLVVSGSGTVTAWASDAYGGPRALAVREVRDADEETLRLPLAIDRFFDGGALWFDVETADAPLRVRDVTWTVEAPPTIRPTALVICTFNRVEDCLNTLGSLAADPAPSGVLNAIYVVDQGSDAVESRPRFAELRELLGERLHYLRQPNLGGAGGYTRGLLEVTDAANLELDGEHANVLFMDDDVVCEPDIVVRLTAFANRTVEPIIVGGQMLYLMHPDQLHVTAERTELAMLAPGVAVPHSIHATSLTRQREDVARRLDLRVDAGYNAWWSCLIPSEIVRACGFPLPMFFQWDDIEYGVRAREQGFATTTLPGAGVWHADFSLKDWDDWARYFSFRNSMITGALHGPRPASYLAKVMARQLAKQLIGMQYGLAATCLKAIEDFLTGPSVLQDGGQQVAQDVRTLRAKYPDTVRHPAGAVPGLPAGSFSIVDAAPEPKPSMLNAVLLKRIAYTALGKRPFKLGAVRAGDNQWWHVSLFERAVVTDSSQEGVRVREYDRDTTVRLGREAVTLLRRLSSEGEAAAQRWRDAMPELTSRENWRRLISAG